MSRPCTLPTGVDHKFHYVNGTFMKRFRHTYNTRRDPINVPESTTINIGKTLRDIVWRIFNHVNISLLSLK